MKNFTLSILATSLLLLAAHLAPAQPLTWATYFGGTGFDVTSSTATDASGNVYITGRTYSASGIATPGAYQATLVTTYGTSNAFLAKFNSAGILLWATYFGGGGDFAVGVATDGSGNVYILGQTSAISGVATAGAYQTTCGGASDAFLAKFNGSGSLLWATYYGGPGSDYVSGGPAGGECNGITIDASGNVYITGYTASASGIATTGAFMTTLAATTSHNAFLAKFSSAGTLLWATYYGGSVAEWGFGVATDGSGNVFLYGQTESTSGIATPGAYMTTFAGSSNDAFIVKFNSSGVRQWGTYYGGGSENPGGMAIDGTGNVFVTGATNSTSGIATPGAFLTTLGGGGQAAYLAKFSNAGSLLWGTYFGGVINTTHGSGIATDGSGNVYFGGATHEASGIATPGAYHTSFTGSYSGFVTKFTGSGAQVWGTYYGDTSTVLGIATDASHNVYFGGNTLATMGIATPGAHQTTYGGGGGLFGDGFLGVFHDTVTSPGPAPITGTATLCVGASTTLSDATAGGTWSSASTSIATINSTGTVTGVAAGTATISYTTSSGTATIVVTVTTVPAAPAITGTTSVCVGHTITLTGVPSGGAWASLATAIATVGSSTGIVTGAAAGSAHIKYTITNACGSNFSTVNVTVTSGGPCSTKVKGKREPPTEAENEMKIYPNPAYSGMFNLEIPEEFSDASISITDLTGRQIYQRMVIGNVGAPITIDLGNIASGMYFVKVVANGNSTVLKLTVR